MKTIKETRELIGFIGAFGALLIDKLEDGRISVMEGVELLAKTFGKAREGVSGIGEVPAEFADLHETEVEVLRADINRILIDVGLSHRIADSADLILQWAYGTVRTFLEIRNAPPAAEGV